MNASSGADNPFVRAIPYPGALSDGQGRMAKISIDRIRCDPVIQPRERLNRTVIREYFQLMRMGESFRPLQVVDTDEGLVLVDGCHRLEAAKQIGLKEILCTIHKGDYRHAKLLSASANILNGLHRTNADKRRAVMKVLSDPQWYQWSDQLIARHCGVTQPFVSKLRAKMRRLTDNVIGDQPLGAECTERRFITKHGTPAVMHLPARQKSKTIIATPIEPATEERCEENANGEGVAAEGLEGARAQLIKAAANLEHILEGMEVTAIRVDPAADKALSSRLKALAHRLEIAAEMLVDYA